MITNEHLMTNYLVQFCYTCFDASRCCTESKIMECFEESLLFAKEEEEISTEELLRIYAY